MTFRLDRRNRLSCAAQVERQALAHLVAGRLHSGDRLPSVRELARSLGISRTTAERIQNALCETMLAEVRPRSGLFVASPDPLWQAGDAVPVQALHEFLKETVLKARELGLDAIRLAQLLGAFCYTGDHRPPARFPIIATRDAYECMARCLDGEFPATLLHLAPNASVTDFPRAAHYLLSGYYLRGRARRIADAIGCSLIYVRYNVKLLDQSMAILPDEFRYIVTRDPDNAETTRGFLASAYPEVPTSRYAVMPVRTWLKAVRNDDRGGTIWPTITAAAVVKDAVAATRVHVIHPLLADDFIEELRCLALFS